MEVFEAVICGDKIFLEIDRGKGPQINIFLSELIVKY